MEKRRRTGISNEPSQLENRLVRRDLARGGLLESHPGETEHIGVSISR